MISFLSQSDRGRAVWLHALAQRQVDRWFNITQTVTTTGVQTQTQLCNFIIRWAQWKLCPAGWSSVELLSNCVTRIYYNNKCDYSLAEFEFHHWATYKAWEMVRWHSFVCRWLNFHVLIPCICNSYFVFRCDVVFKLRQLASKMSLVSVKHVGEASDSVGSMLYTCAISSAGQERNPGGPTYTWLWKGNSLFFKSSM